MFHSPVARVASSDVATSRLRVRICYKNIPRSRPLFPEPSSKNFVVIQRRSQCDFIAHVSCTEIALRADVQFCCFQFYEPFESLRSRAEIVELMIENGKKRLLLFARIDVFVILSLMSIFPGREWCRWSIRVRTLLGDQGPRRE